MFGFDAGHDVNVVDGLEERIRLLQKVNLSENGYQLVLSIGAKIGTNYVSSHNKFTVSSQWHFLLVNSSQDRSDVNRRVIYRWLAKINIME